jgi:multiple sugar transport system ATP-binding protein
VTLSLQGLQKIYPNNYRAVENLDLEVRSGEFFTLLGPSGCGKTTTLRMIAGLEMPTSGKIFIGGRDFTNTRPRDRDVAMVFQGYALYPHMTVEQNLVLNLRVHRIAPAEIALRLREVSRMLDIESLLDRKPRQLSGGQRQRVALGRALIRRPNVFLMDEPMSNLDLKLRERTRNELKNLHKRLGVTTVFVTHDQAEALVLSSRIGIMNSGLLLQVGAPQQIYDHPTDTFVAKFVGSPSINLLAVAIEDVGGHLKIRLDRNARDIGMEPLRADPDVITRLKESGMSASLGIRPESLELRREAAPLAAQVSIEFVESMGAVSYVVLRFDGIEQATVDGEPFIAVVRSNEYFEQGSHIWLVIRPDRLVLFHPKTGKALAGMKDKRWHAI